MFFFILAIYQQDEKQDSYVRREKCSHQRQCNEVKILNKKEHWIVRRLKESTYILGYGNLLTKPSVEINVLWQHIIKKERKTYDS